MREVQVYGRLSIVQTRDDLQNSIRDNLLSAGPWVFWLIRRVSAWFFPMLLPTAEKSR